MQDFGRPAVRSGSISEVVVKTLMSAFAGCRHTPRAAGQPSAKEPTSQSSNVDLPRDQPGFAGLMRFQCCNFFEQAGQIYRFGVEVVAAGSERLFLIAGHGMRRKGDHRNAFRCRVGLDPPGCLFAVDIR